MNKRNKISLLLAALIICAGIMITCAYRNEIQTELTYCKVTKIDTIYRGNEQKCRITWKDERYDIDYITITELPSPVLKGQTILLLLRR